MGLSMMLESDRFTTQTGRTKVTIMGKKSIVTAFQIKERGLTQSRETDVSTTKRPT